MLVVSYGAYEQKNGQLFYLICEESSADELWVNSTTTFLFPSLRKNRAGLSVSYSHPEQKFSSDTISLWWAESGII